MACGEKGAKSGAAWCRGGAEREEARRGGAGASRRHAGISSLDELLAADAALDLEVAGRALDPGDWPHRCSAGAHEPTPTPYFIARRLLEALDLDDGSHLLDVGCGTGRVLACHAWAQLPGKATGVELDGELAAIASSWSARYDGLAVLEGSAIEIPLAPYTHFYLFNPFDNAVLLQFLDRLEDQALGPVTLAHMSDNGESYSYMGRPGWTLLQEGSFHTYPVGSAHGFEVYGCPQHYSVWRYRPA